MSEETPIVVTEASLYEYIGRLAFENINIRTENLHLKRLLETAYAQIQHLCKEVESFRVNEL